MLAALVAAGAAGGEARLRAIDGPAAALRPFQSVEAPAILLERPRGSGARTHAELRLVAGSARGAKLLAVVDGPWPGRAEPGTELLVRGIVRTPARGGDDHFDWPAHLLRRGIAYELDLRAAGPTGGRRGGVAGVVDAARRRAEAAIDGSLSQDGAALMRGMVLGQDERIDALTRDDWRDSGLAHLLAVSGQNVMLLCALALPFLALAGASPRMRAGVLVALIAVYVPLAGAGPSIQRAGVMGAAGLLALGLSRPASASYGLLLAAVATLALNPRVSGDAGWQMSFAAVAGILAARPLAPRHPAGAAVWLTAVAGLATTPLLAAHFAAVPLVSIPANLAALPAVAPVMWIGMLQAALGQIGALGEPAGAVASAAAKGLGLLGEPLLGWLRLVASRSAAVPHAVAEASLPGPAAVLASYAVLALAGWALTRAVRRARPRLDEIGSRARTLGSRRAAAASALAAIALLVVLARIVAPSGPSELTVSFLDVGQGDATLVQHPDGSSVLFDGGRPEARVARLLRQAGVRRLAAVVATHASADHHGGLAEVIRTMPVDLLVDGGDGTADPSFRRLLADARTRRITVIPARAGKTLHVGSLSVRILSPPPRPPGPPPADPNPRAVVAVVTSGAFDLLLSADAESPTLRTLDLPPVEAMKVPHHGSADPGLAEVLRAVRPLVAVVPVGPNSYGHPHPDTIRTLDEHVPHVRRTDRDGTVRLRVEEGRMVLD